MCFSIARHRQQMEWALSRNKDLTVCHGRHSQLDLQRPLGEKRSVLACCSNPCPPSAAKWQSTVLGMLKPAIAYIWSFATKATVMQWDNFVEQTGMPTTKGKKVFFASIESKELPNTNHRINSDLPQYRGPAIYVEKQGFT